MIKPDGTPGRQPQLHREVAGVGSLTIVGTGIAIGQMTLEARACFEQADCLLALVTDPIALEWLKEKNPNTESLHRFYGKCKPRDLSYREMVEHTMSILRRGRHVCLVLYGHPGVFAFPPHELMRRTSAEKIPARMLPGVSAEDCLFADLGLDPGQCGCQSFEATDFLLHNRRFDPTSALILWQFGITGEVDYPTRRRIRGVKLLSESLAGIYGADHQVIVYEAAVYPMCKPMCLSVTLASLPRAPYTALSTLLVPPKANRPMNRRIARSLGLVKSNQPRRGQGGSSCSL